MPGCGAALHTQHQLRQARAARPWGTPHPAAVSAGLAAGVPCCGQGDGQHCRVGRAQVARGQSSPPGPLGNQQGEECQLQDEREPEAQADVHNFTLGPGGQQVQMAQDGPMQLPGMPSRATTAREMQRAQPPRAARPPTRLGVAWVAGYRQDGGPRSRNTKSITSCTYWALK